MLSDAGYKVEFDLMRNQLARNIDVLLDSHKDHPRLAEPLRRRRPDRSCFVLLTPEILRKHYTSRLYGWLYDRYKNDPSLLGEHLQHRREVSDWDAVSKRIGWLTFEKCNEIAPGSCAWLTTQMSDLK